MFCVSRMSVAAWRHVRLLCCPVMAIPGLRIPANCTKQDIAARKTGRPWPELGLYREQATGGCKNCLVEIYIIYAFYQIILG